MLTPYSDATRPEPDLSLPFQTTNGRLRWPAAVLVLTVLCGGLWGAVWAMAQAFTG